MYESSEYVIWWKVIGLCGVSAVFGASIGILAGKARGWNDAQRFFAPNIPLLSRSRRSRKK